MTDDDYYMINFEDWSPVRRSQSVATAPRRNNRRNLLNLRPLSDDSESRALGEEEVENGRREDKEEEKMDEESIRRQLFGPTEEEQDMARKRTAAGVTFGFVRRFATGP